MEKVIRLLLDDTEDGEVEADAGTVHFGLDGKNYEIDLSKKNATRLRTALQKFVEKARPVGAPKKPKAREEPSGYNRDQFRVIREWGRQNGFPGLSDKGRVSAAVLRAYEDAARHNGKVSSAV